MSEKINSLEELYNAFSGLNMEGGWHRLKPALWSEPVKNFEPNIWHYKDVKPLLDSAGHLIGTDKAERRNLTMKNPAEGNIYPTVRSIVAAYQMIKPSEVARSHRHTPNALRLILEGHGTYTVVNGHRVEMRPGDVLLTPSWAWHSHENVGEENCYWMDFLDVPFVHLTEAMFYEPHPQGIEKDVIEQPNSPLVFRWEETLDRLESKEAIDTAPEAHRSIEFGSPALSSIALNMQKIQAGRKTATVQTTANIIYAVLQGSGTTNIDGQNFHWSYGDTICVPSWRPYHHTADKDAILFKVSDAPILSAFNWLRTNVI